MTITFDELVEHGRANGANIVNGMPWSWTYHGHAVTHEHDDCYLIATPDGTLRMNRGDVLVTRLALLVQAQERSLTPIDQSWAEAANSARGLCISEANRWRYSKASPETAEHWESVATRLGALYMAADLLGVQAQDHPQTEQRWRPITTAPPTSGRGLRVLVYVPHHGYGSLIVEAWVNPAHPGSPWVAQNGGQIEPTHWMPLPHPPAETTPEDETP